MVVTFPAREVVPGASVVRAPSGATPPTAAAKVVAPPVFTVRAFAFPSWPFTAALNATAPDPVEALRAGLLEYRRLALDHPRTYEVMFLCAVPGFQPSDASTSLRSFLSLRTTGCEPPAGNVSVPLVITLVPPTVV